jgi:TatD DNase family protein
LLFVDAHIHLSDPNYSNEIEALIDEARTSGVVAMVSNSVDCETSKGSIRLAERYPDLVYSAIGVHPWSVREATEPEIEATERMILERAERVVGVGEVGMDGTYEEGRNLARQEAVFRRMLTCAEKTELPVIVHSRNTVSRILETLASYRLKSVLFHWYSGPAELLRVIVDRSYYVSEGPPVVYSPRTQEIVRSCPLPLTLSETDGPVEYRGLPKGTRTTPALIPSVVGKIAEIKGVRVEDAAEQILRNFGEFFGVTGQAFKKR